jgi:hypothetical protein
VLLASPHEGAVTARFDRPWIDAAWVAANADVSCPSYEAVVDTIEVWKSGCRELVSGVASTCSHEAQLCKCDIIEDPPHSTVTLGHSTLGRLIRFRCIQHSE